LYTRIAHRARAIDQRRCGGGGGGAAAHRPFCYAMRPCEGRSAKTQGRPIEEAASDRDHVSEGAAVNEGTVGAWLPDLGTSCVVPTDLRVIDNKDFLLKRLQPEVSPLTFVDFPQPAHRTKFKIKENLQCSKATFFGVKPLLAL
jgi:hypothetical protein